MKGFVLVARNNKVMVGRKALLAKSCTECWEVKQASEFTRMSSGYYDPKCKPCHAHEASVNTVNNQKESLANSNNHRQLWTNEDFKLLQKLMDEDASIQEMAVQLNRTVYAIYTVRTKYGIRKARETYTPCSENPSR